MAHTWGYTWPYHLDMINYLASMCARVCLFGFYIYVYNVTKCRLFHELSTSPSWTVDFTSNIIESIVQHFLIPITYKVYYREFRLWIIICFVCFISVISCGSNLIPSHTMAYILMSKFSEEQLQENINRNVSIILIEDLVFFLS